MDSLFLEFQKHKTFGTTCWGCCRDNSFLDWENHNLLLNVICHFQKFSNNHYITRWLPCGSVNLGLPNIQIFIKKLEIKKNF